MATEETKRNEFETLVTLTHQVSASSLQELEDAIKNCSEEVKNEERNGKNLAAQIGSLFLALIAWVKTGLRTYYNDLSALLNQKVNKDLSNAPNGCITSAHLATDVHARFDAKADKNLSNADPKSVRKRLLGKDVTALFDAKADKDFSNVENGTIPEELLSETVQLKLNLSVGGNGEPINLDNYYTKNQTDARLQNAKAELLSTLDTEIDQLLNELDRKADKQEVYTKEAVDEKLKYTSAHTVTNPFGDLADGDNLAGRSFEEILCKMLCPAVTQLKAPSIESLTLDESELESSGTISLTIHRTLGSGQPSHYAIAEDEAGLTNWTPYVGHATQPFDSAVIKYRFATTGEKTVYVKLKNDTGESNVKYAYVTYGNTPYLKAPNIESLSVDESELQATGKIGLTIRRTPGSGKPSHYAIAEDEAGLTNWMPYVGHTTQPFDSAVIEYRFATTGEKTVYVKLKNDTAVSAAKSVSVQYTGVEPPKMYLGTLESSDLSNVPEVLASGLERIKEADLLAAQNLQEYELSARTLSLNPVSGSVMLCAVPADSAYKVTKDNGFGGHTEFQSGSGQAQMTANGDKTLTLAGIAYRIYGEDVNVAGERTLYVEPK